MLFINTYEPEEIKQLLQKQIEIEVKNFTPADYLIGNIAIERKTIDDFITSLVSGRLLEQLHRLKSCYQVCFLLIEGYDLSQLRNVKIIYSAIIYILIDLNIRIIFTANKEQTVAVLLILAGKTNAWKTVAMVQNKQKQKIKDVQLEMLALIPNLGRRRASLLLESCGSLQNICNKTTKELAEISGIGRKTAKRIKNIFQAN